MSLSLIITGVIFLLLFVAILVSAGKNKKKKQIEFVNPLNSIAGNANCKVSHYDIWNNSIIGIDETTNFVFSIRKTKDNEAVTTINLAEIVRCRVSEFSRTTGPKEGNIKAFDRIDLVFMNKEKSKPDVAIEFYNSNTDRLTLAGELQLANKWCDLINKKVATLSK